MFPPVQRLKISVILAKLSDYNVPCCNAGLAGERSRWEVSIVSLEAQLRALPGDVALASAFMSYAGPFPSHYREDLARHTWQKQVGLNCVHLACILHTAHFSILVSITT